MTTAGRPLRRKPAADGRQPEDFEARLRAGLTALGVLPPGIAAQQALTGKLLAYLALIAKWNQIYNLTAVRDPAAMLCQHLLDSAAIARPLRERMSQPNLSPRRLRVVDVGSGAGLPGIVLALLWSEIDFALVEPVGKKAAFLRQVALELALANVEVAAVRVEALPESLRQPAPDAIVCRAFASLPDFASAIHQLVGPHTVVAAMKGILPTDEITALPLPWRADEIVKLDVPGLSAERHLIFLGGRAADIAHAPSPAGSAHVT